MRGFTSEGRGWQRLSVFVGVGLFGWSICGASCRMGWYVGSRGYAGLGVYSGTNGRASRRSFFLPARGAGKYYSGRGRIQFGSNGFRVVRWNALRRVYYGCSRCDCDGSFGFRWFRRCSLLFTLVKSGRVHFHYYSGGGFLRVFGVCDQYGVSKADRVIEISHCFASVSSRSSLRMFVAGVEDSSLISSKGHVVVIFRLAGAGLIVARG